MARLRELEMRRGQAQAGAQAAQNDILFLNGAIDDLKYMLATWVDNDDPAIHLAVSRSAGLVARPDVTPIESPRHNPRNIHALNIIEQTAERAQMSDGTPVRIIHHTSDPDPGQWRARSVNLPHGDGA